MSSKKEKRIDGQQFVDDLFRKITDSGKTPNRDTVVTDPASASTPNNTLSSNLSSSAKKRTPPTPPTIDQSKIKKYHLNS